MNDIDRYLEQACGHVSGPDSLRQHLRQELREHLEEAIDAFVATGMSNDEATAKAIEGLGEPEVIRDEMQAVYGPNVRSLLVDEVVKWKSNLWHLAAQVGLTVITTLVVWFMLYLLIDKTPQVFAMHAELDINVPASLARTASVSRLMVGEWYLLLIGAAVAWGLFEWKWSGDNKPIVRTVVASMTCVISIVTAFWIAAATLDGWANVYDALRMQLQNVLGGAEDMRKEAEK